MFHTDPEFSSVVKVLLQSVCTRSLELFQGGKDRPVNYNCLIARKSDFVACKQQMLTAGPRSTVPNVSGYRCMSDCRSRGRKFDPGPVPYFRRLFMKWFLRSFSSLLLIHSRRVVVSYKRKYVYELLVNRLFKPAQEKSVVR